MENDQDLDRSLKLDNVSLQSKADRLPAEIRDAFLWFGCYFRDECGRNFETLGEHFAAIKVSRDQSTWSKILRGLYQTSANGKPLESPVLSAESFLADIGKLQKAARIKEQGGRVPFVSTPTAKKIFNLLDWKRSPDVVCKFGVIIGETGTGKTAALKEYRRLNNHGLCTHVDAPATPSMYQFVTDLAARYGYHPSTSYARKTAHIADSITEKNTVIVENVQRLYAERDTDNQTVFSYLQKLQEDTGCTIIMTFTPVFLEKFAAGKARGYFEQFIGRAGGQEDFLRLPPYPTREDVLAVAHAFKLREAAKHAGYLVKIAELPGRIRQLFNALQKAKIMAESRQEPLTIEDIREVTAGLAEKEAK